jgi:hypothetical protein
MSKYTITIEGDFEKGECEKCPISPSKSEGIKCFLFPDECPLEEEGDE